MDRQSTITYDYIIVATEIVAIEIVTKSSGAKCRLLIHYDCLVELFHARAER